jgi:ATP-dependent Lon protease
MADDTSVLFNFPSASPHNRAEGLTLERDLVVLPLLNTVLFPHMLASLFLSGEAAIAAVEETFTADRLVLAVAQREIDSEPASLHDLYTVGVEAHVQRMRKMPDGTLSVVLQGRRRMRLLASISEEAPLRVQATPLYIDEEHTLAVQAMMRAVLALFEKVVRLSRTLPDDAYVTAMNVDEPGWLADLIASTLPLGVAQRQQILETLDPEERLHRITTLLTQELDVLELENRIQTQVQQEVDRSQREFFLREQLKIIQRELGQDDPAQREINQLRARVLSSGMSEQARNRATEELDRLETMAPAAPEYAVIRTYLDWLLRLPWQHATDDATDLRAAARLLDQQHYGLARVKERILEFMAVRMLAGPAHRSPILCFVGPPGVGKTSLGKSIAEALGRRFVRLSLGGVHDEAEIRGHRRTYIGAMPGRIVQMMKEAGTVNPLFMLDEVDKLGADFRGDPAAALLEVLDPEQNNSFTDHYLDLPYDLSRVTFITTANFADDIPEPLLDRMELIELHGYTEEEKLQIARRFLLPKQYTACGLPRDTLSFSEPALQELVRSYTYEAGVRNLEREIGAVCRKVVRRIAEGRKHPRLVTPASLHKYLGPPRYTIGIAEQADQVGVATGMVYTNNGGDIMPVEVSLMEGKGGLLLTGQLGEVMQESAQAALSYARSNAKDLGIDPKRFDKIDIHVHVPEGGVPKDGPSAGVTMAVALISALSGRSVRRDVAMTGEITLRGRVLPIGGVKEKVLGAYRAGLRSILLPEKNRRDIVEIPARLRAQLTFTYIAQIETALELLLGPAPEEPKRARRAGRKGSDAA